MRLMLQVLRLCFWALPVQRACTVAGVALMAVNGLVIAPASQAAGVLEWGLFGFMLAFLPLLVLGGALWRSAAAQDVVTLAPHGRARLLAAAIALVLSSAVAMATYYWLMFLWLPPRLRMGWDGWWQMLASTFVFGSWWAIASFFAARSSLAMLSVLLILLGGSYAAVLLDLPLPGDLSPFGSIGVMLLAWALFGFWFLRARRIASPAWSARRAEKVALVTRADTGGISPGLPRAAALERLLLGGRSIPRIIAQSLLALCVLEAMLFGIRELVGASTGQVAPLHFLALLLLLPVVGGVSHLVTSRIRPLWLASGCTRAELFAQAEKKLLQLAAGLACVGVAGYLALWWMLPLSPRTAGSMALGLLALVGLMLFPVHAALLRMTDAADSLGTTVAALLPAFPAAFAYLRLFSGGAAGTLWWYLAALLPVAFVALRELARRRWLLGDMPRGATAPAS